MKSELVAPVVKTLFIPEGNPGIREIKDIIVLPRIRNAAGDSGELTLAGEMDIELVYLSEADKRNELRQKPQGNEAGDISAETARQEILARLEQSLIADDNKVTENEWRLSLEIPFTMAFDTDNFADQQILEFDPVVQNVNWVLINPTALEFEAVLKLQELNRAEHEEISAVDTGDIRNNLDAALVSPIELADDSAEMDLRSTEEVIAGAANPEFSMAEMEQAVEQDMEQISEIMKDNKEIHIRGIESAAETSGSEKAIENIEAIGHPEAAENCEVTGLRESYAEEAEVFTEEGTVCPPKMEPVKFELDIPQPRMPEIKHSYHETGPIIFPRSGYYQMKFYRVQYGEDLDAVSEKLGVAKEIIKAINKVTEEEIKTGLLLSIPKS